MDADFEEGGRATARKCRPLCKLEKANKTKQTDSLLELPEATQPCQPAHFRVLNSRTPDNIRALL